MKRSVFSSLLTSYVWVFAAAILIRLMYFRQALANNPLVLFPIVDAEVYVNWARAIIEHGWIIWPTPINYTPAHPLLLAFFIFITGGAGGSAMLFNLLLGAAQAVLIGKTAERVWNSRRTGLFAALAAATYWPFIVFEASFFAEAPALFCLATAVYCVIQYTAGNSKPRTLATGGFLLAYAALTRPHIFILYAPFIIALVVPGIRMKQSFRLRRTATEAALFLLPVIILSGLIIIGNGLKNGSWKLRTMTSVNLYLGNDPALDSIIIPPGVEWNALMLQAVNNQGEYADEANDYWIARTRALITSRFPEWLHLQARKFFMHFGNYEISQEIDVYAFREYSPLLRLPVWPGFATLLAFAMVGMIAGTRNRSALLLLSLSLLYAAGMFPFQAASRFRLPLALLLTPFAGCGLHSILILLKQRHIKRLTVYLLILAFVLLFSLPDYTRLRQRNIIRNTFFRARQLHAKGALDPAAATYRQAAHRDPSDPNAPLHLGYLLRDQGQLPQALSQFQESARRFPDNYAAHQALADCLLRLNRPDQAQPHIQTAMRLYPGEPETLKLARKLALYRTNTDQALEYTRLLLKQDPHDLQHRFAQALLTDMTGNIQRATELFGRIANQHDAPDDLRQQALLYQGCLLWQNQHDFQQLHTLWTHPSVPPPTLINDYLQGTLDSLNKTDAPPLRNYLLYLQALRNGDTNRAAHIQHRFTKNPPVDPLSTQATLYRWLMRKKTSTDNDSH
jgi:tetratricopeptide (TPR) repeat protein